MRIILVLFQFNLIHYAITFVLRKPAESYPGSSNIVNNLGRQSANDGAIRADIKFTFLANDHFKNIVEIPSIENLIKSLRIPGFNVYRIVFNQEGARNYEKFSELSPKLNTQAITEKSKHTGEYLSNFTPEKRNNSDTYESKKAPDSEIDKRLIEIKFSGQNSTDEEKYDEETTTVVNEVTTDIDLLNENSTVRSDYDDESYGSLSERSEISPSLLASLIG